MQRNKPARGYKSNKLQNLYLNTNICLGNIFPTVHYIRPQIISLKFSFQLVSDFKDYLYVLLCSTRGQYLVDKHRFL